MSTDDGASHLKEIYGPDLLMSWIRRLANEPWLRAELADGIMSS